MALEHLAPLLVPAVSAVIVAFIGLAPKKEPREKRMGEELARVYKRLDDLEESTAQQWSLIQDLRAKVDFLYERVLRLKAYIRELECKLKSAGIAHKRPEDIDELMDENPS